MPLVAVALSHLLSAYLVVGEPFVGRYCYRALQHDVATDSAARRRFFWLVMVMHTLVDLRFLVLFRADGSPEPSGVAQ